MPKKIWQTRLRGDWARCEMLKTKSDQDIHISHRLLSFDTTTVRELSPPWGLTQDIPAGCTVVCDTHWSDTLAKLSLCPNTNETRHCCCCLKPSLWNRPVMLPLRSIQSGAVNGSLEAKEAHKGTVLKLYYFIFLIKEMPDSDSLSCVFFFPHCMIMSLSFSVFHNLHTTANQFMS